MRLDTASGPLANPRSISNHREVGGSSTFLSQAGLCKTRRTAMYADGQKVNETYEGKVVVFAGRCGNGHSYDVSGPITNGDGTVTLAGMAPQFDLNCNATGQQQKHLYSI